MGGRCGQNTSQVRPKCFAVTTAVEPPRLLSPSAMPVALPWPSVPVALGDCVTFHEYLEAPGRKFTWEAEKVPFERTPCGRCGTDVLVRRRLFHAQPDGTWQCVGVVDRKPQVSKSSGAWRLRVYVGDEAWGAPGCGRAYLHKIAAWCWHRQRYGHALSWADCSYDSGWQGDHLPQGPDLRTFPELAVAGHVEVVPAQVNAWRKRHLQVAQDALALVEEEERARTAINAAFVALRNKAPARGPAVRRQVAVVRNAQQEQKKAKERELQAMRTEGRRLLLEWDVSWEHTLERAGLDPAQHDQQLGDGIADSPYAAFLFVEYDGTPRRALLAYTLAKAHRLFFSSHA